MPRLSRLWHLRRAVQMTQAQGSISEQRGLLPTAPFASFSPAEVRILKGRKTILHQRFLSKGLVKRSWSYVLPRLTTDEQLVLHFPLFALGELSPRARWFTSIYDLLIGIIRCSKSAWFTFGHRSGFGGGFVSGLR